MNKPVSLKDKLEALRIANPVWRARYDGLVQHLVGAAVGSGALKEGNRAPEFILPSAEGGLLSSAELLARGPLVLSFYRGQWCPYCRTELEALQEVSPQIHGLGATL